MVVSDSVGGAAEWLVVEDLVSSFSFSAGVFDLLVGGGLLGGVGIASGQGVGARSR